MDSEAKKHPCADCRQCQWCSDDRCRLCLRAASGCRRKLSMAEQIALYELLNAGCGHTPAAPAGENPESSRPAVPFDLENSDNPLE